METFSIVDTPSNDFWGFLDMNRMAVTFLFHVQSSCSSIHDSHSSEKTSMLRDHMFIHGTY